MKPASADFRADINGLRAVAVIAVVLFHFRVAGFSGGFVGVDAFFVISGYLMTRLILGPLSLGHFSVLDFYLARARRIFPALAALCSLLLAYGWFSLSPMDYQQLAKHAGASLLFISNHTYWKESGYFDADAHEKWLLHTWSLSVEWQFYLLYPLLVVAVHRLLRRPSGVTGALWAVFLASLAWSAWLAFANPSKAFFLLPTRAWEMLAGGLIFVHQDACNRLARKLPWREPAGLAAILAASLLLTPDTPWPGLAALLPVVGAALLLLDSGGRTRLLGGAPVQAVGRWSYSIYLWHWPVVVWLHQSQSRQHGAWIAAGMAASILLGWLSFRLAENPARRFINRFRLATALAVSAAMVLAPFAIAAALHYQSERVTALRFKDHPRLADVRALEALQARYFGELYKPLYREGSCFLVPEKSHDSFAPECAGERPRIVLWGDSHAAHLWPGLKAATLPGEAAQWTASGCPPLIGEAFSKRPHCGDINEWVLRRLLETKPPVLVLAGAWIKHNEATIRRGLEKTLARLGADPAWRPRIILVGSVPAWRKPLPKLLASDFLGGDERQRSRNDLDPDMARRDTLIRELAAGRAEFFSPIAVACNEEGCLRYIEKDGARLPFAFDYGHMIEESSVMVVAALFRQLSGAPARQP
ncbi:MAG: acyltransferase [Zoogloeaceae bacterium]|nr:acyltransferase [Zoogloeaceae bacterium]